LPDPDAATLPARRGSAATFAGAATLVPSLAPPRAAAPPATLTLAADDVALELDRPPRPPPQAAPPSRSGTGLAVAVAAIVLSLAAVAGARLLLLRATPPPPPASVQIHVADLPRGAHVFVDGAASPASFTVAGDRQPHRLRLQAAGYADKALLFVPDADQTIDGRMTRSR
jgi:hypothetical protein